MTLRKAGKAIVGTSLAAARLADQRLLVAIIIALPLFTAFGPIGYFTYNLRVTVVLIVGLVSIVYFRSSIAKSLRQVPRITLIAVALFLLFSILSSLHSLRYYTHAALLGAGSDQIGLLTWLSFLIIGLCAMPAARSTLLSPKLLYILLPVGALSLWVDRFYISDGLRLGGLLYQSTSLAIYGCLGIIVACRVLYRHKEVQLQVLGWLTLILYTTIILLTQSRIGWLGLIIVLVVNGWLFACKYVWVSVFACLTLLLMLLLPVSFHSYFSRYEEESVVHGSSYRLELYKASTKDVFHHDLLFGNGTDTLPPALNNRRDVPEDVAKALDQGYIFTSAHNIFIDIAYYFGAVASLALVVIIVFGLRTFFASHDNSVENINYLLLFLVLLMNALVNIPSIELTPLFLIVLLGLFGPKTYGKNT